MDCSEGLQRSIWRFDVTAINISSEQTADRANVLYKIYILLSVIIFFSVLNYSIPQRDFSDTDTYLYYIDYIYFFRDADWWHFEGLSKITMLALRFLTQDTLDAVSILRYVLILVFSLSMYYMYRSISWQGLAIAVALYAPLLGLVTIRATPAYILVALSAIAAMDGKWRSMPLLLSGFLFHVSTALAIPAIFLTLALSRYGVKNVKTRYIYATFLVCGLFYGVIGNFGAQSFLDFLGSFSYLAKYTVYIPEANSAAAASEAQSNMAVHYALMGGIVTLAMFLIYMARDDQGVDKLFIAISVFVYVSLFLLSSPVVSTRYSPFFILPALARIDISFRGGWTLASALGVLIFGTAIFLVNIDLIIL